MLGCYLTKVDATAVILGLRLLANDSAHRDKLRSALLADLSRRFDGNVPTGMLWGRVDEYFYINPEDLSLMLARLGARKCNYMA